MSQHPRFPIRPIYDVIIVKLAAADERNEKVGGLYLPMGTQGKEMREGDIVAAGPGHMMGTGEIIPLCVKVGDRVMFGEFAGMPLEWNREKCLAMREQDLIGVIEPVAETALQ